MSLPRSLSEKLTKYATDNFDIWLRKTNIVAREEGDLNDLDVDILNHLNNSRQTITECSHPLLDNGQPDLNKFTFTGENPFQEDFEILVEVGGTTQTRVVRVVAEDPVGTFTISVDRPFNPQLPDNSTVINLTVVNLVNAINHTYDETRRVLVRAIAMS